MPSLPLASSKRTTLNHFGLYPDSDTRLSVRQRVQLNEIVVAKAPKTKTILQQDCPFRPIDADYARRRDDAAAGKGIEHFTPSHIDLKLERLAVEISNGRFRLRAMCSRRSERKENRKQHRKDHALQRVHHLLRRRRPPPNRCSIYSATITLN